MGAMIFIFERFFFQIFQGSTAQGILKKWQVPHPMETIEVEHSREIWSKTTAWAAIVWTRCLRREYEDWAQCDGSD